jgi:plastocyanin
MRSLILSTALLAAFSVAGCGNDTTDTGQPLGRKLPPNGIDILVGAQNKGTGAFTPNPLTISLANGGVVEWFNDDETPSAYGSNGVTHNITADDSSFTSGNLPAGQTFQTTFTSQGTFTYHCAIHPRMKGTVTVTP